MGNNLSSLDEEPPADPWWPSAQLQPGPPQSARSEEFAEATCRGRVKEDELEIFKKELAQKRAIRQEALGVLQKELRDLRLKVDEERSLRHKAEEERDKLKIDTKDELQRELETEKEEKKRLVAEVNRLMEEVEEKLGLERQVQALKDVSQIGKEMLRIRELQVKELKKKLVEINISSVVAPPEDLRLEYEKQIENIRKLRTLYEERAAATLLEHKRELEREEAKISVLETKLSDVQKEIEEYKDIKKDLEVKIEQLENTLQQNEDELEKTKDDLFSKTAQNSSLNSQMNLINNLFSNMLVRPDVGLDRLTRHLNEHHGLISDLTMTGDSNEVAALLVDLAEQMDKEKESDTTENNNGDVVINPKQQSEIASNLSKVWRVMIELLSHHQASTHTEPAGSVDSCYKSIQTPSGIRSVISVSQTFLTLKDLILEKNKLVKEVGRLKTLNYHLEHRLGSQEKRLSVVTTELRKTWAVVNKLKAQHKQLHTHEKILRYELQQKRCMLTELKGELEHCREKWEKAREKNSQTEEDWKQLRKEFAARKSRNESNSAESGYEEDDVQSPPSESNQYTRNVYELPSSGGSEPELSEEDIEHSDGNSFDTVIDLLDITCIDNQRHNQTFVLSNVPPQTIEIPQSLLPLTGNEFTEGLDQIESEDLAAVLDIQYQTQLLGADYNLSLPSSSGSSPIPTENDDFTSSEVDISEEDISSKDNHIYSSPMPQVNNSVSEDILLFGSNSSKNISLFLDGLFVKGEQNGNQITSISRVPMDNPSTSKRDEEESIHLNLTIDRQNDENACFCPDDLTPIHMSEDNLYNFSISDTQETKNEHENAIKNEEVPVKTLHHQELQHVINKQNDNSNESYVKITLENENKTQDQLLKAREDRLKSLEHQCRCLVNKVTSTSFRSEIISNKLDELHLTYGPVNNEQNEILGFIVDDHSEHNNTVRREMIISPKASSSKEFCSVNNSKETKEGNNIQSDQIDERKINCPKTRTPPNESHAQITDLHILEDQCISFVNNMSTSTKNESHDNNVDDIHTVSPTIVKPIPQTELNGNIFSNTSSATLGVPSARCQDKDYIPVQLTLTNDNIESKPPDIAFESTEVLKRCSLAGPSMESERNGVSSTIKHRTAEEMLEARAERFKRLEDQCKSLLSKMTATSLRSEIISNKLDELHSCYGSSEDASDNEEHSLLLKNTDKRSSSSPRSYSRNYCLKSNGKQMELSKAQDMVATGSKMSISVDSGLHNVDSATGICRDDNIYDRNTELLNIITEGQRFNSVEDICQSHPNLPTETTEPQHSPTETSPLPNTATTVCSVEENTEDGNDAFTDTISLHTDAKGSDYSNKSHQ